MFRKMIIVVFALLAGAASAYAQETAGAGRVEIGVFPGGGIVFTESTASEPNFGNYAVGGSLTFNANEWIGMEGEFGRGVGVRQDLAIGQSLLNRKTPNMWMYSGNVIVSPLGSDRALVPYLTAGVGGLTMSPGGSEFANANTAYETFFTDNLGGGVKWFSTRHLGFRGDYRLFTVSGRDTAPAFFGLNETRYGHRLYGGLVLTY